MGWDKRMERVYIYLSCGLFAKWIRFPYRHFIGEDKTKENKTQDKTLAFYFIDT